MFHVVTTSTLINCNAYSYFVTKQKIRLPFDNDIKAFQAYDTELLLNFSALFNHRRQLLPSRAVTGGVITKISQFLFLGLSLVIILARRVHAFRLDQYHSLLNKKIRRIFSAFFEVRIVKDALVQNLHSTLGYSD